MSTIKPKAWVGIKNVMSYGCGTTSKYSKGKRNRDSFMENVITWLLQLLLYNIIIITRHDRRWNDFYRVIGIYFKSYYTGPYITNFRLEVMQIWKLLHVGTCAGETWFVGFWNPRSVLKMWNTVTAVPRVCDFYRYYRTLAASSS